MAKQMTESEWLSSTDPERLLHHLDGHTSPRKLRLIACAGCRLVWHFLPGRAARAAVECGERFADGLADDDKLEAARSEALRWRDENEADSVPRMAAWAAAQAAKPQPTWTRPLLVRNMMRRAVAIEARRRAAGDPAADDLIDAAEEFYDVRLCDRIRDVFGNPFRPSPVDPSWLRWEGGTVVRLAAAIYEGRRFEDLPILADALEEAGCADEVILAHCRSEEEHVLGCWALDAVLGKA